MEAMAVPHIRMKNHGSILGIFLKIFTSEFFDLFWCYRKDRNQQAFQYICGLMQAQGGKNMERMVGIVKGLHFVQN